MTGPAPQRPPRSTAPTQVVQINLKVWLRSGAKWATWIYLSGLCVLLLWLERFGEQFWLTGILLFAPPQILLLPLIVLIPCCLLIHPRSLWWHAVSVAVVAFAYMSFRWVPQVGPREAEVRVVTHNIGQGNRPQFYNFLANTNPDVIVMQDARAQGSGFARQFPNQHVAGVGEFLVVSRIPILHSELLPAPTWGGRPVAARFELLWHDHPLIVYNVHLPTPRRQLNRFLSGHALAEIFADEDTSHRPAPMSYGEWTTARLKLASDLADVFAHEPLPFLACGDFNTPDHGRIYHTFARGLLDAHLHGGQGWGLSFPGATRNPFSMHGPWLRIDYAFAGQGWEPIECTPEPGRRSQHCAVMARFVTKS